MGNLGSLTAIPLTMILVPLILRRMSYFKRPDVLARRIARAQLPGWVSLLEMIFFGVSAGALIILFFLIETHTHRTLHQGRKLLGSAPPIFSAGFVFWLIQVIAPVIVALPLGMLLANFLSWLILPVRNIEKKLMVEGVPGYTWHELNYGLIKSSLTISPVCVILTAISLTRIGTIASRCQGQSAQTQTETLPIRTPTVISTHP